MLEDFFTRSLVAGVGVALVAGPLGCFIVWRRMAYFGDTISHSALLGVSLAFLLELNIMVGVFVVAACVSLALLALQRSGTLSSDAILGILSHSALALGLVMIAFMTWLRIDLMGYLFGDILAVSKTDIALLYGGGAAVLAVLVAIWRPLLAETACFDLAGICTVETSSTSNLFPTAPASGLTPTRMRRTIRSPRTASRRLLI